MTEIINGVQEFPGPYGETQALEVVKQHPGWSILLKDVSLETVRGVAARAVLTKGEGYIYPRSGNEFSTYTCWYLPQHNEREECDTPCVAGLIFRFLGIPDEALGILEGRSASFVARRLGASDSVAKYIRRLQTHQDRGGTWGDAYKFAEGKVAGDE